MSEPDYNPENKRLTFTLTFVQKGGMISTGSYDDVVEFFQAAWVDDQIRPVPQD